LTQDFLAQMLGVRRASVNAVVGRMRDQGLIAYTRGVVTITNRHGLEAVSCECYAVINREFERVLGRPPLGSE
jgi:Mn-dependent DtxR family transcriptional regulator